MNNIIELFKTVLEYDDLTIDDNFFALGGNSIKAGILIDKIQGKYNGHLTYQDFFTKDTIGQLIDAIVYMVNEDSQADMTYDEDIPLSLQQAEIVAHDLIYDTNLFKIICEVKFNNEVLVKQLELAVIKAFQFFKLLQIEVIPEKALFRYSDKVSPSIFVRGIENESTIVNYLTKNTGFVEGKSLVNVYYQETTNALFICMHHMVADELSMKIFIDKIIYFYNLKETEIGCLNFEIDNSLEMYKKFIYIQEKMNKKPYITFREKKLKGINRVATLQHITKPNSKICVVPAYKTLNITVSQCQIVENIASTIAVSVYSVWLALFKLHIYEWTHEETVCIGFPLRVGNLVGAVNEIGNYVSESLSSIKVDKNISFIEFVNNVSKEVAENIDFSLYPFATVVKELPDSEIYKNLPQRIHFNYIDESFSFQNLGCLSVSKIKFLKLQQSREFELIIGKNDNQWRCAFVYREDVFSNDYVELLSKSFEALLQRFVCFDVNKSINQLVNFDDELEYAKFKL